MSEIPPPTGSDAMKATLTDRRFSDPDWVFERKLDGIRCIAVRDGGGVRLLSRNDLALNGRYPEIAAALEDQPARRFAVDGEVVAFAGAQTSFARLAQRGRRRVPVFLYAFDLLWLDGEDLRPAALLERKRRLRATLSWKDPVRWTALPARARRGPVPGRLRQGLGGADRQAAGSPYVSRARSRDWLKLKCEQGQELVVAGWTAPRGAREDLGALLLGHFDP